MLQTLTAAGEPAETDEQLMLGVRDRVAGAFERLFDRYRAPLWRFFRRRVTDPGWAEELVQDVFTAVFDAAPRYEPRAAFRSYLFGIAYNVLMTHRRKHPPNVSDPIDAEGVADVAVRDPDPGMWVRQALATLDREDREILMLREYEQLSYQEIADLRGMPLNTVRSRLFRARLALKQALVGGTRSEENP
jgi:RNA polymerase sigma-70 factor (ECF subfamily)